MAQHASEVGELLVAVFHRNQTLAVTVDEAQVGGGVGTAPA